MYSLPQNFDSSFLVGKQVENVCFLEYQVNIYFSESAFLQIEGAFEFVDASGTVDAQTDFPILCSRLPGIAGDFVEEAEFDRASGNIRIVFVKGATLLVYGDSGPYESYRLSSGTGDIIV